MSQEPVSFGVFKPVGHVVMSFPTAAQADAAAAALAAMGLVGDDVVHRYTDRQMLEQIDRDLERASALADLGQELNLVRAHRELAAIGYHWLIVKASGDSLLARVSEIASAHGAERAQHYGIFIIEELIDRPGGLPQVSESPARGLDAQTPSGRESEAAGIKQAERGPA